MSHSVVVQALKATGPGPHRIDWFGNVQRGRAATHVAIMLSPWSADRDTGEMRPDSARRRSVFAPLPFLRLYRIGDVWEGGRFTGRRDVRTRETFALDVQEGAVTVAPGGAPLKGDSAVPEFPLPFATFDGHREHTGAFCARIDVGPDVTLVVPCMELVRFYFGASGSFLKRLFWGAFALDKLYSRVRRNPATNAVNGDLADDLIGTAATTVARIALEPQARNAAAWIVNSAVASSVNRQRYYPKTTFPFFGRTDLTVAGRWIGLPTRRVFLAEQVLCCTHPFPFGSLYYTTQRSPITRPGVQFPFPQPDEPVSEADTGSGAVVQLEEVAVSATLAPMEIPVEGSEDPFPDLAGKRICRVKDDRHHRAPARPNDGSGSIGVGDGAATSDSRAAEVATEGDIATFDETTLEEAPAELIETFASAYRVYGTAGNGGYTLSAPVAGPLAGDQLAGPFVRASTVCNPPAPGLARVWCAIVDVPGPVPAHALALVRGDATRDYDDQLTLVRLEGEGRTMSEIERYCRLFARGTLLDEAPERIVLVKSSASTFDVLSFVRGFSVAFGLLLAGGAASPLRLAPDFREAIAARDFSSAPVAAWLSRLMESSDGDR